MFDTARRPAVAERWTARWLGRWQELRDLLGGVLILTAWLALWTSVWAAVAGPLSPVAHGRQATHVVADGG